MYVRDWMTEQLEIAHPDDDVALVRRRLHDRRIRQMPVVAEGRLVGIITDRDLRSERDPAARVVAVMTPDPATVGPGTPIEDAAVLLRARKIGALPVVEAGALVGIVSESDLLRAFVELTRIVEPTTLVEFECEDGIRGAQRARGLLERRGGQVVWMRAAADPDGRLHVGLRVRVPIGHAPEQILEEAGFRVSACVSGRTVEKAPLGEAGCAAT
jgi:acetoin utilization protein AcuB